MVRCAVLTEGMSGCRTDSRRANRKRSMSLYTVLRDLLLSSRSSRFGLFEVYGMLDVVL